MDSELERVSPLSPDLPLQAPAAPLEAEPAAPPAAADSAASANGAGDDAFWDHKVEVPDDATVGGRQLEQPPQHLLVPAQLEQQAATGSGNDLVRLFAGIKVGGAAAPAAPAAPGPPAAAPMMLLTPQLLQQEAAAAPPAVPEPAPGSILLKTLLRGSQQQQQLPAAVAPAPQPVDITGKPSAPPAHRVFKLTAGGPPVVLTFAARCGRAAAMHQYWPSSCCLPDPCSCLYVCRSGRSCAAEQSVEPAVLPGWQ